MECSLLGDKHHKLLSKLGNYKACITNPLTGKLLGEVEADKTCTSNKEFYFMASILMV